MQAHLYIGTIAGCLTSFSSLPQIYKCYKTKSCKDLSWALLIIQLLGVLLWICYGAILKDALIITFNVTSTLALSTISIMKFKYDLQYHESDLFLTNNGSCAGNCTSEA